MTAEYAVLNFKGFGYVCTRQNKHHQKYFIREVAEVQISSYLINLWNNGQIQKLNFAYVEPLSLAGTLPVAWSDPIL